MLKATSLVAAATVRVGSKLSGSWGMATLRTWAVTLPPRAKRITRKTAGKLIRFHILFRPLTSISCSQPILQNVQNLLQQPVITSLVKVIDQFLTHRMVDKKHRLRVQITVDYALFHGFVEHLGKIPSPAEPALFQFGRECRGTTVPKLVGHLMQQWVIQSELIGQAVVFIQDLENVPLQTESPAHIGLLLFI